MQQLSAVDSNFIYLENGNNYSHISGLAIYDPSTAPNKKVRFKQVLSLISERVSTLPAMRSVLKRVPFELDFPYWVDAGTFDPEFHVRHLALPHPGDWRQLCIQTARLHSRPLDRGRPMWEMYVIEGLDKIKGLPKGCFAIFIKVHHAAIDGASTVTLAAETHDLEPNPEKSDEPPDPAMPGRVPSNLELMLRGQFNTLRKPTRAIGLVKNAVPGLARYAMMLRSGAQQVGGTPRTRFNGPVSPHRVFESASFELDDIRKIKRAVKGATVNDVAVTLCCGAMRKYLEAKGELPDESMVAMMPINVRTEAEKDVPGNLVTPANIWIHSDIADPRARLKAVQRGNAEAKELTQAVGARLMMDASEFLSPALTAAGSKMVQRLGLGGRGKPGVNTTITNVPGLQVPIYFCGAQMVRSYGLGTVMDGMGLFHSVTSYCGRLAFSITADREMMPDPDFYADCLRASFDELMEMAE